jgi:hypothetical protein
MEASRARSYTGEEAPVSVAEDAGGSLSDVYQVRPPAIPSTAVPVFDAELGAVIGYSLGQSGLTRYYDLDGNCVGMDEKGLESPLLDPIDLLLLVGGLVAVLRGGFRVAAGRVAAGGAKAAARGLSKGVSAALRALFLRVNRAPLQFTTTTAARMANPARRVPVHILRLAVRHGARAADPQGVAGAVQYAIPMLRNGKAYTLKVILRQADNTVLHFHYF